MGTINYRWRMTTTIRRPAQINYWTRTTINSLAARTRQMDRIKQRASYTTNAIHLTTSEMLFSPPRVVGGGLAVRSFWSDGSGARLFACARPARERRCRRKRTTGRRKSARYTIYAPPIHTHTHTYVTIPPPPLPIPPHSHISREIIAGASVLLKHTLYNIM